MSHPNPYHDREYRKEGYKPTSHSRALSQKIDSMRKKASEAETLMKTAYRVSKNLPSSRKGYKKP